MLLLKSWFCQKLNASTETPAVSLLLLPLLLLLPQGSASADYQPPLIPLEPYGEHSNSLHCWRLIWSFLCWDAAVVTSPQCMQHCN
jgi:hypothetical protein